MQTPIFARGSPAGRSNAAGFRKARFRPVGSDDASVVGAKKAGAGRRERRPHSRL